MRLRKFNGIAGFGLALVLGAFLVAPARANDSSNSPDRAVPGTLNYVEGTVSIGSQAVTAKSVGSASLEDGQSLTTEHGKAEVLLTPGVFLRVGNDSSVKMISSSLTDTEVELDRGHAMVEVAEIHPENLLRVVADGETTELVKTGLYDFDLSAQQVRVFDGKAEVEYGDGHFDIKGGHEVPLEPGQKVKTQKFDKKEYAQDDLYRWSSLRSAYVAEANVNAAAIYADSGWGPWGAGWWGAGWYWDPWFAGYTFIPGDGIFYSPFGWGFYSPWWVYSAPYYGVWGRPGYYHRFGGDYHNWGRGEHYVSGSHYAQGVYRGTGSAGAFHSGARGGGFSGGGARGGAFAGGGGFHGGGFSGGGFAGAGFHGGGGGHGR